MTDYEYSIQEAAERLGVPVAKLRRWDTQGVLVAVRTEGGHRRYLRELIDQIAVSAHDTRGASHELASVKRSLDEKRHIIQLLVESETRYRDLVETSHDLIWSTDAQGCFTYLNGASQHIFGLAPGDMLGRCFFGFEVESAHIANRRFLSILRRKGEVRHYITHLRTRAGEDRWIGINARVILNDARELRGLRGTARDITEEHRALKRVEYLALHDTLTSLPNRHAMKRTLEQVLAAGTPGALLIIDIDHFKRVNDDHGHRVGDQIVTGIGNALRHLVHGENVALFRTGGDEFAILLRKGLTQDAVQMAERALTATRHYHLQAGKGRVVSNISASIGIALHPFHGDTPHALLSNVDMALQRAKALGRNRYALYESASGTLRDTHRRSFWVQRLREALDHDQVELFAQPVVRLADRVAVHHEVLMRVRDQQGELAAPGAFMAVAESSGLIQELDLCVLDKTLAHVSSNGRAGAKHRYFLNMSGISIADGEWVNSLVSKLVASTVNPGQLVFEVNESALLADLDASIAFIRRIKAVGGRVAIDNFGAGFSSFYYMSQFDADYVKIDGHFVRTLATDQGSRLFVKALIGAAQELEIQVIAQWVENESCMEQLRAMGAMGTMGTTGAAYGQGFFLHAPRPLGEFGPLHAAAETA